MEDKDNILDKVLLKRESDESDEPEKDNDVVKPSIDTEITFDWRDIVAQVNDVSVIHAKFTIKKIDNQGEESEEETKLLTPITS